MEVSTIPSLAAIDERHWDALHRGDDPFLSHAFLSALERTDCLEPQGWRPLHLLCHEGNTLAGALPLYLRDNSLGEFVFDWNWADAYQRTGQSYYPKLVSAIPFVPATGARLLVHPDADRDAVSAALCNAALALTDRHALSSWHCLFPTEAQAQTLGEHGLLLRHGCQYHWRNRGYRDFDAFLAQLNARRRKEIRRERRQVEAHGLIHEVHDGTTMSPRLWSILHRFYCSTFARRWGAPRLTEAFFNELGRTLPRQTLVFLARDGDEYVAGAYAMRGTRTLYGRHWGCSRELPLLHFELCYYRTIDYCIQHGLEHFDAGAQGEHKIPRGFEPVTTYSAHYLREPRFRRAIADFLRRETAQVALQVRNLAAHSPYRAPDHAATSP